MGKQCRLTEGGAHHINGKALQGPEQTENVGEKHRRGLAVLHGLSRAADTHYKGFVGM